MSSIIRVYIHPEKKLMIYNKHANDIKPKNDEVIINTNNIYITLLISYAFASG